MKNIKKTSFKKYLTSGLVSFLATAFLAQQVLAQDVTSEAVNPTIDDQDIVNIEGVYANPSPTQKKPNATTQNANQEAEQVQNVEVKDLKDLSKLAPFREVSIIQRKFLPKTERFQVFAGAGFLTNTPWYNNYNLKLGLGYNFTETLGVEFNTGIISSSESKSAQEIKNNNLRAQQFVYTKNYYGVDFVWSPIYGKMTNLDRKITPFDMYFAFGFGSSTTDSQEKNNSTLHIGVGQIFAISKAFAFRWDYSYNTFQATPLITVDNPNPQKSNFNDLILSAGVSWFFPEVSYR